MDFPMRRITSAGATSRSSGQSPLALVRTPAPNSQRPGVNTTCYLVPSRSTHSRPLSLSLPSPSVPPDCRSCSDQTDGSPNPSAFLITARPFATWSGMKLMTPGNWVNLLKMLVSQGRHIFRRSGRKWRPH